MTVGEKWALLPAIAALVVLALASASARAGGAAESGLELKVYALNSSQGRSLEKGEGPWLARLVRRFAPLAGKKVQIDRKTVFHVVLLDHGGRYKGKLLKITWLAGSIRRRFARPQVIPVRQSPGYPQPMAVTSAWSSPSKNGGLLSSLFGGGPMSRDKWERSRCYGPRTVRVADMQDRTLAEAYFEIHPAGRSVY